MKLAFAVALFIAVVFVGWNIFTFLEQSHTLSQSLADVQSKLTAAQAQEANLQEETQYLSNPANLEKELRSQFNYTKPGEKMVIIVQPQPSSTTP